MKSIVHILSSNTTDFTTIISPPIQLNKNKQYEAALLSVDTYNSIPNITDENNKFTYSNDKGINWKTLTLSTGSYELQAINDEIQRQMIVNEDYDHEKNECYITISAHTSELKSIINITNESYLIDFTKENSIGSTLGFSSSQIEYGYTKSEKIVNITKVNKVLIKTNIISGSYVNGSQSPVIYSFNPNKVSPGYKIDERPNPKLIYHPVNNLFIDRIHIWLTDQNNNQIDLRGETVTITLHLREVKNVKQEIKKAIKELKSENIL